LRAFEQVGWIAFHISSWARNWASHGNLPKG
jgi:hypothetical protein